ncbi:MAG: tyrosine-type recombinase/integrase [Microcoleaceae cyanobacterium]
MRPIKRKPDKTPRYKGNFGITVKRNSLVISVPRELNSGNQEPLYTGLRATPENRAIAEAIAAQMRQDYALGRLDPIIKNYKPRNAKIIKTENRLTLLELFQRFKAVREKDRSCNTIRNGYKTNLSHLGRSLYANVNPDTENSGYAQGLCDWATGNLTPDAAYRLIMAVNACMKWAIKSRLVRLEHSPFEGMASEIKSKRSRDDEDHIDPFTRAERDMILERYRTHPSFCHYYLFVSFRFFSGCRPGEAEALYWETVSSDLKSLTFTHTMADKEGGRVRKKGLKTQLKRTIYCSERLIEVLTEAKARAFNQIVFPSIRGSEIHRGVFNRTWKCVLEELGIEYRKPYQTRHTFITLCVDESMNVKDIAKLVGNSPEVILRNYVDRHRKVIIPEL